MTGQPYNVMDEMRAVIAEAARLVREGGTVDERAAHQARKQRVLDELQRIEQEGAQRAAERAHAALRERGHMD